MKNKKIYGFVLLALIIMLLPIGMVSAKYKKAKDVGTVTLDIAPPILSPNWYAKNSSDVTISELIVDSFTPEADPNRYSSFSWDDGKPVGYDSDDNYNFKNNVRLFEKENGDGTFTTYILAIGKNPVIFPENSSSLFAIWTGTGETKKITFNNIDTSNVNNMQWMFYFCQSLTSLDVSSFNTSHVTNMNSMFINCTNLETLTLGNNFDTSNVIDMENMFNTCSSLTSLDVSKFNTSKVTKMTQMFNDCSSLTNLDLSKFDTSSVTDMAFMFNGCESLTNISFSTNFKTDKVTNMSGMFGSCISLPNLDLRSFDTAAVTDMNNMFYDCRALKSLDLNNFTTPYLTNMDKMFMQCSNLENLYLSSFITSENTTMADLFTQCNKLKKVTLGENFKFNYSTNERALLPGQNFSGADGKWYISNSGQGYNSTQVAEYHNNAQTTTTYYAVKSEAPASANTFSLLTENGTINGAIQGN